MKRKILSPARRIELARQLWGWEPHPTQREWLLDRHPVKVAACGRRWGKTEAAAVDVATCAIANNGSVQMIVAPTYDQSKLITNTVERLLLSSKEIRAHVRIVRTPYPDIRYRESRIMARTADEDGRNLRGHSADRVIVDEAAFVRDEVVEEVIGPMLADRNGELVMISTPLGKNHFYRAFVRGQAEAADRGLQPVETRVRSFRFPSWANPHISREYIEAQREMLTDRQFKVEYEAEFLDNQNAVFPWEDIQAAISVEEAPLMISKEECMRPAYVAGVDWARYSDYTAVVVMEIGHLPSRNRGQRAGDMGHRMPDVRIRHSAPGIQGQGPLDPWIPRSSEPFLPHYRVVAVERFNRMEWHVQVERVADLVCRLGVRGIAADQTSAGDPVLEMLRNVLWTERGVDADIEGVVFTNQSKRELIDNLAVRLARRELTFPNVEALVRELQFYEYELTEAGNMRMGARRGYHDDCVCALALAMSIAPRYRFQGSFRTSGHVRQSVKGW